MWPIWCLPSTNVHSLEVLRMERIERLKNGLQSDWRFEGCARIGSVNMIFDCFAIIRDIYTFFIYVIGHSGRDG